MDAAHFHLIINHFSVVGFFFLIPLLIVSMKLKSQTVCKLTLACVVVVSAFAVPAYLSGEEAEDILESRGASHELIEHHEEAAKFTLWAAGLTGGIALIAFVLSIKRGAVPKWSFPVVLIFSLWAASVFGRVAYLGAQISHPEIRPNLMFDPGS